MGTSTPTADPRSEHLGVKARHPLTNRLRSFAWKGAGGDSPLGQRLIDLSEKPLGTLIGLGVDLVSPFGHRRSQIVVVAQPQDAKPVRRARTKFKFDLSSTIFLRRNI